MARREKEAGREKIVTMKKAPSLNVRVLLIDTNRSGSKMHDANNEPVSMLCLICVISGAS